jgi:hypothetical protein
MRDASIHTSERIPVNIGLSIDEKNAANSAHTISS